MDPHDDAGRLAAVAARATFDERFLTLPPTSLLSKAQSCIDRHRGPHDRLLGRGGVATRCDDSRHRGILLTCELAVWAAVVPPLHMLLRAVCMTMRAVCMTMRA
eukprot:139176-Chlamydomonas_euryale.AAC.1